MDYVEPFDTVQQLDDDENHRSYCPILLVLVDRRAIRHQIASLS
jgi:hypothetical protein